MQLPEQGLPQVLLRQLIPAAGAEIQVLVDQNPAVRAFVARLNHPPRIERGLLPECP